jgi:hypothetical protein
MNGTYAIFTAQNLLEKTSLREAKRRSNPACCTSLASRSLRCARDDGSKRIFDFT